MTSEPLIKIFIFWSRARLQRARSVLSTADGFIKASIKALKLQGDDDDFVSA